MTPRVDVSGRKSLSFEILIRKLWNFSRQKTRLFRITSCAKLCRGQFLEIFFFHQAECVSGFGSTKLYVVCKPSVEFGEKVITSLRGRQGGLFPH